jgi:hypothetical protein
MNLHPEFFATFIYRRRLIDEEIMMSRKLISSPWISIQTSNQDTALQLVYVPAPVEDVDKLLMPEQNK